MHSSKAQCQNKNLNAKNVHLLKLLNEAHLVKCVILDYDNACQTHYLSDNYILQ